MEDRASEAEGNFEGWLVFLLKTLLISDQKVLFTFLLCYVLWPVYRACPLQEFSESCQELGLKQQQANMLGSSYEKFLAHHIFRFICWAF